MNMTTVACYFGLLGLPGRKQTNETCPERRAVAGDLALVLQEDLPRHVDVGRVRLSSYRSEP